MNILNVWERLTMSVTTHPSKGMCDSRTKELRRSIHLRVSVLESNNYLMWLVASSVRPISPGLTNSVRSCPRDLFGKQNKTKKKIPSSCFSPPFSATVFSTLCSGAALHGSALLPCLPDWRPEARAALFSVLATTKNVWSLTGILLLLFLATTGVQA